MAGGKPVPNDTEFSFFALIYSPIRCGGVFLSEEWVLSAAHCLAPNMTVGYCGSRRHERVVESIVHPLYTPHSGTYDIGLYRLANPAVGIRPIVVDSKEKTGQHRWTLLVLGMGHLGYDMPKAKRLQQTTCTLLPPRGDNSSLMYQAEAHAALCHGDSGGPLLIQGFPNDRYRLLGILTRILNVHDPNPKMVTCPVPDHSDKAPINVFVNIFMHLDWIANATRTSKDRFIHPTSSSEDPCCNNGAFRRQQLTAYYWLLFLATSVIVMYS